MANLTGFQLVLITGMGSIVYLELGILKSFGVLIDDITLSLGTSTSLIGTAVGLCHGLSMALAIICPWLMQYISLRKLTMCGSVVGSLGFIVGSFSQTGFQFLMCLILSGIGYGVVLFPSHSSLLVYFPGNYKALTSVLLTAGGVGMMTLPVLVEKLHSIYSWRSVMLLEGGLCLNAVACCALFRPPERVGLRSDGEDDTSGTSVHSVSSAEDIRGEEDADLIPQEPSSIQHVQSSDNEETHSTLKDLFRRYPLYTTIPISVLLSATSYNAWVVFVVPNAVAKGFPLSDAVFLSTIGGAGNILGRFAMGLVLARKILDDRWSFCILLLLSAVVFFLNYVANSFVALAFLSTGNGFLSGSMIVVTFCLPQSLLPPELVVFALSLHYLMFLGEVAGGAIMGWLHDTYHSYNLAFAVAGLIDVLAILVIIVPFACHKIFENLKGTMLKKSVQPSVVHRELDMQTVETEVQPLMSKS